MPPLSPAVPTATARLRFRLWTAGDLPLARALFGDPRVTALVGGPFDDAAIAARLALELAHQRDHALAYWPIAHGGDGDVGCCGLKPRAVEAGASVIAHAFGVLGAAGLFAGHHPENHGSRRALARLGFRYAHDELDPPTGLQHPGYTLTRPRS